MTKVFKNIICAVMAILIFVSCAAGEVTEPAETVEPPTELPVEEETVITEPEPQEPDPMDYIEYTELWNGNYAINSDYIGQIRFDSGLIDLPMVQGETNDTYLRTNWETLEYDVYGAIFLDYRNTLEDQNLIIYGHFSWPNMDPERKIMFTPLEKLIDEENYEENRTFRLILDGQIRTYDVVTCYYCPIYTHSDGYEYTADDMQYYRTEYDEEYLKQYITAVKEHEFYDTGEDVTADDKLVTLQTCVYERHDLRLIVLAKEIERVQWAEPGSGREEKTAA